MADIFTRETRSRIMSRIRSKNTKAELLLRKALRAAGLHGYRIHGKALGSPDVLFSKGRVAIFVDGDFWHGYDWRRRRRMLPRAYWRKKISGNMVRDAYVTKQLSEEGWTVLRFWEHDIAKDAGKCARKVQKALG